MFDYAYIVMLIVLIMFDYKLTAYWGRNWSMTNPDTPFISLCSIFHLLSFPICSLAIIIIILAIDILVIIL